ncbi:TetR/AcrR family transcriptional regulator [Herminiimonas sp.]|uniref:TetR/AcrR family transcriptional regulator n=1 Tax=Herminiimonas sp. TaxID=1926289 RepID=UPI00272D1FB3|nr:TetR/AcrR family transcriptional regulator [Herminiimonas sp.]
MATRISKTPQSPTQKADKKRIEVLKAAGKCFRKTGFHQTSMQQICAETGLGPGAVYRYFTGKEAIIEAMVDDERRQARAMLLQMREAESIQQALTAATRLFAERYRASADASLMTEVYAEGMRSKRVGIVLRKIEAEWIMGLTNLLRLAQARGQIDATLDAAQTALFLTGMWDGMVIRQHFHAHEDAHALPAFFDMMIARLLAKEGKPDRGGKAAPAAQAPTAARSDEMKESRESADLRQLSLI